MGLHFFDIVAIIGYLVLCVVIGIRVGGSPSDPSKYFTTEGSVPWWAVSFSIVATETSILTVISTPTLAYFGSFTFVQIVFGYIIGRFVVAYLILPSYFKGNQKTAYTFFNERFGHSFERLISIVFLITRLLADGVRLFAAAIPIKLITGLSYPESIAIIAVLTLAYTFYGGLKSVIWIDVLQLCVYLAGGIYIVIHLAPELNGPLLHHYISQGKLTMVQWPHSFSGVFTVPYNFIGALIGGMFLTMASHGTDHLMVQRLLACNGLKQARKALISSGFVVLFQFLLFLGIGFLLFVHYHGQTLQQLGLHKPDEIFPDYVLTSLPVGLTGFIIAGLFAAAMSTLSSSLSALSSSTLFDILPKLARRSDSMKISRYFMLLWTVVFIGFAVSFTSTDNPVIVLGLGIAGFTYGGLLGAFLIGRYTNYSRTDAVIGLLVSVATLTIIILFGKMAWPWYTFMGVMMYALAATISNRARRSIKISKTV